MEFTTAVTRFIHWHRRSLAAALAGLAVLILVSRLAPGGSATVDVVVTTRTLSAGDVIGAADVMVTGFAPEAVPDGAPLGLDDVVGQTPAMQIRANSVLQGGMLASGQLTAPGRALVPVALPDQQLAPLLPPGTAVTLVHISETGFDVLTSDARVAALPTEPEGPVLSPGPGRAPLVLIDVPADVAAAVSVLGQRGELSIILGGN